MDQKSGKQIKAASRTTSKTSKSAQTTKTKNAKTAKTTKTPKSVKANPPAKSSSRTSSKAPAKTSQKPKSKIGLILGIVFGIIILAIIGLVIWFFAYYNRPDKVAFDAVRKVINSDNVAISGAVRIEPKDKSQFQSAILFLESSSDSLPNSAKADLLVTLDDQKEDGFLKISLGTVALADGEIYLHFDGLEDSLVKLGLDESFGDFLREAIAEADGEWWRISASDISESFDLDQNIANAYADIYGCVAEVINQDKSGELTKLYTNNQFISVDRINDNGGFGSQPEFGYSYYRATVDNDKLAKFINALPETTAANNFYACYNDVMDKYADELNLSSDEHISAADFAEIDGEDISKNLPEDLTITLEISNFTHELRQIHVVMDDEQITADFALQYAKVQISAPAEYRPLSEFVEQVQNLFYEAITGGFSL